MAAPKQLSEQTLLEQKAGRLSLYRHYQEMAIKGANDDVNKALGHKNYTVELSYNADKCVELVTIIVPMVHNYIIKDEEFIRSEPFSTFPSDHLIAQLMLLGR